ncbi:MAG: hypothetical protein AAGH79_09795 [Bacteroidota bacterium]
MYPRILLCHSLILLLFSCQKDPAERIPADVLPHVEEFFLEAQQRGLDLALEDEGIDVVFEEIDDPDIVGLCRHFGQRITIDPTWWERSKEEQREWLVFHELGHCVLDRRHRNEETPEGTCLSMMRGNEDGFGCSLDLYSEGWRSYLIDELFSETTSLPEWAQSPPEYDANTLIDYPVFSWADSLTDGFYGVLEDLDLSQPFWLEASAKNLGTEEFSIVISLGLIAIKSCKACAVGKAEVYHFGGKGSYFDSDELFFEEDVRLTFYGDGQRIYCYVNQTYIHSIEPDLLEDGTINSNRFEPPLISSLTLRVKS